jgi:hypothetical protein
MEDHQRQLEIPDSAFEVGRCQIIEQGPPNPNRSPDDIDLDLILVRQLGRHVQEAVLEMAGIAGSGQGRHCTGFRYSLGRRQHRGTAKAVANQKIGRPVFMPKVGCGRKQILEIG